MKRLAALWICVLVLAVAPAAVRAETTSASDGNVDVGAGRVGVLPTNDFAMNWYVVCGSAGAPTGSIDDSTDPDFFVIDGALDYAQADQDTEDVTTTTVTAETATTSALSSGRSGEPVEASMLTFSMAGIAPNPLRTTGQVVWSLPRATYARLSVLDVQGREVAVLADGAHAAGRHVTEWKAAGDRSPLSPGLYFLRLQSTEGVIVRRAVLAP